MKYIYIYIYNWNDTTAEEWCVRNLHSNMHLNAFIVKSHHFLKIRYILVCSKILKKAMH